MKERGRRGDEEAGTSGAGGTAPGKRTRTEAIQRRRAAGSEPPASATEGGVGGGGGGGNGALPAPVQRKMEDAFDFDFSSVRVHQGGEAQAMGAHAFTQGTDVHFAPGQYDPASARGQELIGHELAHVVQQSEGRVQATTQMKGVGLNDDSSLEREADDWGARAARGESVDRGGSAASASSASGAPVQRFKDFAASGEEDSSKQTHWANSTPLRVADDGTAAVAQDSIAGSQELYVLPNRLSGANAALKAANAPLTLVKASGSVSGGIPGSLDLGADTLERVKPVEVSNPKKTKEIPDDCGNAARTVTGTIADKKQLHAEYTGKDGTKHVTAATDPEMMKYEIMVDHFGDKIAGAKTVLKDVEAALAKTSAEYGKAEPYFEDLNKLNASVEKAKTATEAIVADYNALKAAHQKKVDAVEAGGASDKADQIKALEADFNKKKAALQAKLDVAKKAYDDANKKYQAFLDKKVGAKTVRDLLIAYFDAAKVSNALIDTIMGPYNNMSATDQEAFDEKVGINRFANPDVGEAYTISSGGAAKSDRPTWNFHWGGVIMKAAGDNITMENYAGNQTNEWYFQMYGVPTKSNKHLGQTFQEQHRDIHAQHGTTPTTLSTEKH
jgi:hypothetical protein